MAAGPASVEIVGNFSAGQRVTLGDLENPHLENSARTFEEVGL
jgi:hypothetical protein